MTAKRTALTTSGLLTEIASGTGDQVTFDDLLQQFARRAFGVMLLVAVLPAFLPLPAGAGAISGPLLVLFGAQMAIGRRAPWVPAWLRRRGIDRARFARFAERMAPWLRRIERGVKPRMIGFVEHIASHVFSGLLVAVLGFLLSLPIPLTNYPLGLLLLAFAVALIERDGALLMLLWVLGIAAAIGMGLVSDDLLRWVAGLID